MPHRPSGEQSTDGHPPESLYPADCLMDVVCASTGHVAVDGRAAAGGRVSADGLSVAERRWREFLATGDSAVEVVRALLAWFGPEELRKMAGAMPSPGRNSRSAADRKPAAPDEGATDCRDAGAAAGDGAAGNAAAEVACSPPSRQQLKERVSREIARIDAVLNSQVNAIVHHPAWQRLEATWRGLEFLTTQCPEEVPAQVRVLDVSWKTLSRDAQRAIEFDQSVLFRKVYEEQFGTPGGTPFGLLLGDFAVQHAICREHPHDDVATLRSIGQVAAAAFVPFLCTAHPRLFGAESFDGLDRRLDLQRMLAQTEYDGWRRLVAEEDARYLGVTLPRVLMRAPWSPRTSRADSFPFEEQVQGPDSSRFLWGSPVFAFGAVAMRTWAASGWFEDMLGTRADSLTGGGRIAELPEHRFAADGTANLPRFSTDILLTDEHERDLSRKGLIPLCHGQWADFAAFHSAPSLHQPRRYTSRAVSRNEELSSQLNLMLCVCRFAHYLKIIARDRTGAFRTPTELESYLHNWIHQYVSADITSAPAARVRFPLREARVRIHEVPGRPGIWLCNAHLRPHLQGDQATAAIKLRTEMPSGVKPSLRAGAAG